MTDHSEMDAVTCVDCPDNEKDCHGLDFCWRLKDARIAELETRLARFQRIVERLDGHGYRTWEGFERAVREAGKAALKGRG